MKIWSLAQTLYYCAANLASCQFKPIVSIKRHLIDYASQYRRAPLSAYRPPDYSDQSGEKRDYVFMIGTLWQHKNCLTGTNLMRKSFVEICQKLNCTFEGGFFALPSHPQYAEFKSLVFGQRYSVASYIEKTRQSAFVFNTPAVHDCHGWKLGEYIAMGKAIVSTPLSNHLPAPLPHGEALHVVEDLGKLEGDLHRLLHDTSYRSKLEEGARRYYEQYLQPRRVIEELLA